MALKGSNKTNLVTREISGVARHTAQTDHVNLFTMFDDKSGEIQVIYGPMFSGKSTELLRRIRRYTAANKQCLVLKYHLDTRYDQDNLSTHDLYVILVLGSFLFHAIFSRKNPSCLFTLGLHGKLILALLLKALLNLLKVLLSTIIIILILY